MKTIVSLALAGLMSIDVYKRQVRAGAAWKEFANYLCLNILFTKK